LKFANRKEFNYYEPIEEFESGDILEVLAHVSGGNGRMCVAVYNKRTCYTTQLVIESIRPLETPEEKAPRLENDFVDSIMCDEHDQNMSEEAKEWAIHVLKCAYRKLKKDGQ